MQQVHYTQQLDIKLAMITFMGEIDKRSDITSCNQKKTYQLS